MAPPRHMSPSRFRITRLAAFVSPAGGGRRGELDSATEVAAAPARHGPPAVLPHWQAHPIFPSTQPPSTAREGVRTLRRHESRSRKPPLAGLESADRSKRRYRARERKVKRGVELVGPKSGWSTLDRTAHKYDEEIASISQPLPAGELSWVKSTSEPQGRDDPSGIRERKEGKVTATARRCLRATAPRWGHSGPCLGDGADTMRPPRGRQRMAGPDQQCIPHPPTPTHQEPRSSLPRHELATDEATLL